MEKDRTKQLEELRQASPLEIAQRLEEFELYDKRSSQEIIDEVYQQFQSAEHVESSVLEPVFLSVIDGLLEAISAGRAARKKGLTASRIYGECKAFRYDADNNANFVPNAYTEYKNIRDETSYDANYTTRHGKEDQDVSFSGGRYGNSAMSQDYGGVGGNERYTDTQAKMDYADAKFDGNKTAQDEYISDADGYRTLHRSTDVDQRRSDDTANLHSAQVDHIVPLKKVHDQFCGNYALTDDDIKAIGNIEDNFALTSATINTSMNDKYKENWLEKANLDNLSERDKRDIIRKSQDAQKKINSRANQAVADNILGKGYVDEKQLKKDFKATHGRYPTQAEKDEIVRKTQKKRQQEIAGSTAQVAMRQGADYAVGNLILLIVKPLYFELSDMFKNGVADGVCAASASEGIKIRFNRVKQYVVDNFVHFVGDNVWQFVKGFISSLIEGIISLFVGMFKQVFKLVKEGIKIFVQSAKILFGTESSKMSAAEKGDAITKLIGGSVIALAGIGLETLINKIWIGEPWSIVLSTLLSGIASALFMYLLDRIDLFSVKAEKRYQRIEEIFDERIAGIQSASESFNIVALETLREQYQQFEAITGSIKTGLLNDDLQAINAGLYDLADFYQVDLPYKNTQEFVDYFDAVPKLEF